MRRPPPRLRSLPSRGRRGGLRWFGLGLVCGLAVAGLAWWGGHRAQRAAAMEIAEVRSDHQILATRERLLTARQQTALARAELGRANFGLANEHLRSATEALNGVVAGAEGLDVDRLDALRQSLGQARMSPDGEPGRDADRLARLEEAIDPMVPPVP